MAARVIPSSCAARGTVSSSGSSLKTVLSNLIHFLQVGICVMCFSVRLRAAAGAERSCFGAVGHGDRDGARSFVFALAAPGDGGRAGAWGRVGEVC